MRSVGGGLYPLNKAHHLFRPTGYKAAKEIHRLTGKGNKLSIKVEDQDKGEDIYNHREVDSRTKVFIFLLVISEFIYT